MKAAGILKIPMIATEQVRDTIRMHTHLLALNTVKTLDLVKIANKELRNVIRGRDKTFM